MSYTYLITCNGCRKESPKSQTLKAASEIAKNEDWVFVRHLGEHYCKDCATTAANEDRSKSVVAQLKSSEIRAKKVERLKILLRIRESGKTVRECGEALGVSPGRAHQLIKEAEQMAARGWMAKNTAQDGTMPFEEVLNLSVRAANCLVHLGCKTVDDVCLLTEANIRKTPNFGAKSLYELQSELLRVGRKLST